jgi:hypothetical protein
MICIIAFISASKDKDLTLHADAIKYMDQIGIKDAS